jgi:hypothetical protein
MPFPPQAANLIRERLDAGRLPIAAPPTMWAGYGSGNPCDGCGELLSPTQVEYEFEAAGQTIRFHLGCAALWEAECCRRGHRRST